MLSMPQKILLIGFCLLNSYIAGEEILCTIGTKKSINVVSDKFLSISVDPAPLLSGEANISGATLTLAKRLAPSYVRLAGNSSNLISYADNAFSDEDNSPFVITPPLWFGVNEWLREAGLFPIFALAEPEEGPWNPEKASALFEITDKLNVSCFWQLGYDCSNKSEFQYKEDLKILENALEPFLEKNRTWKIIGSDMSKCFPKIEKIDDIKEYLEDFQTNVEAVTWELSSESLKPSNHPSKVPVWTSIPIYNDSTFASLFTWAPQLEESAKLGFHVVFAQPNLGQFENPTPGYWFAVLHKKLMGKNVLDVKPAGLHSNIQVYSHCTKNQNQFVRRGSVTMLVVNNNTEKYTVNVKFGLALATEKTMEVQSYVLTAPQEDSLEVFLNDKLPTEDILYHLTLLKPKVRRAKLSKHILLEVSPKSVSFFVFPDARASICDKSEVDDVEDPLEGSEEIENILAESRSGAVLTGGDILTLERIKQRVDELLENEGNYIKQNKIRNDKNKITDDKKLLAARKLFLDTVRLKARNKHFDEKKEEMKNMLIQRIKKNDNQQDESSKETEKVGSDQKLNFTNDELETFIDSAWEKFKQSKIKRAINIKNLEERYLLHRVKPHSQEIIFQYKDDQYSPGINLQDISRMKREINTPLLNFKARIEEAKEKLRMNQEKVLEALNKRSLKRSRRDINIDLLKKKTDGFKSKKKNSESSSERPKLKTLYKHKDEKMASIRKPGQTSDELLEELMSSEEVDEPIKLPSEIFAELASDKEESEEGLSIEAVVQPSSKSLRRKNGRNIAVQPGFFQPKGHNKKSDYDLQFATEDEVIDDFEDVLPSIHEFYGNELTTPKTRNRYMELWEIGMKNNDELENRDGFSSAELDIIDDEDYMRKKRTTEKQFTKQDYRKFRKYIRDYLKLLKRKNLHEYRKINVLKHSDASNEHEQEKIKRQEEILKELLILKAKLASNKDIVHKILKEDNKLNTVSKSKDSAPDISDIRPKRSIFDKDILGNYKILKPWKSNNLQVLFPNRIGNTYSPYITPNKYFSYRVKRGAILDADPIENEIFDKENDIKKERGQTKSKGYSKKDYEYIFPKKNKPETNDGNTKHEYLFSNYEVPSKNTNKSDGARKNQQDSNVQKIPKNPEQTIIEKIVQQISGFFSKVGNHLRSYWNHMWT